MIFKKGTKVEVLTKKDQPFGCWHCAEIVSGDGHNYMVRYYGQRGAAGKNTLGRVSNKLIRPLAPLVQITRTWLPGDIVEVFDNFSWKMATICKVLEKSMYLVRLTGFSQQFRADNSEIRIRQAWHNGKWSVIGQMLDIHEERKHHEFSESELNGILQSQSSHIQKDKSARNHFPFMEKLDLHKSHVVTQAMKNVYSHCYPDSGAHIATTKKRKLIQREGKFRPASSRKQLKMTTQAAAVALQREMPCENSIHASVNFFDEMVMERVKATNEVSCSLASHSELNEHDTVTCSVGSCSINSHGNIKLLSTFNIAPGDSGNCVSDAESSCRDCGHYKLGNSLLSPTKEVDADIHTLELHAYRCTMEALHASGNLSWEQEALVTNLRLSLNISNDEHLMQLKNFTNASIPIS